MPAIEEYLIPGHYDLASPDGKITKIVTEKSGIVTVSVFIENISPVFVGFSLDPQYIFFNLKSTLAQLGVEGIGKEYELNSKALCAEVLVDLIPYGPVAKEMLKYIQVGTAIGKLFAADPRRIVRDPEYLSRMFGRSDRWGRPLLSLGGLQGSDSLILDRVDGRTVAYLALQKGQVKFSDDIYGFLPSLGKALESGLNTRQLVKLHQIWDTHENRNVTEDDILLVKTLPLHIRTVFARVVSNLLSPGYEHTSASVLQPDTHASGDIYELYGNSKRELTDIPLEFYTLEPYKEHVFFYDRDQLLSSLEEEYPIFQAFQTIPTLEEDEIASTFVVKGEQLLNLKAEDWIKRHVRPFDFPGTIHSERQGLMVERYIEQQPSHPFLAGISHGTITSQGILLCTHFPSPLMKRMLLGDVVQRFLKGIYFVHPSLRHNGFFSAEDRALLHDLERFGIPVFWVDLTTQSILRYLERPVRDNGMFVPISQIETFFNATVFGIYGSNLMQGDFETELHLLLQGLKELQKQVSHPLLNPNKPLALVTGGGPGAMEVGNRVAMKTGILSCANVVDFTPKEGGVVNEQHQNRFIQARMTYRLDKIVERQAEFNLDFPIFLTGGIGTDFEYALEEVRRKVGAVDPTPILLFGEPEYWKRKIAPRFNVNLETGTICGSEWVSNCFYSVRNAQEGLEVYKAYFTNKLDIGKRGSEYSNGFVIVSEDGIAERFES